MTLALSSRQMEPFSPHCVHEFHTNLSSEVLSQLSRHVYGILAELFSGGALKSRFRGMLGDEYGCSNSFAVGSMIVYRFRKSI